MAGDELQLERSFTIHGPNGTNFTIDADNAESFGLTAKALLYLYREQRQFMYCEARYGSPFSGRVSLIDAANWRDQPGAPFTEWGAVVSSIFISLCGCHQLLYWRHDSTLLHVIAALFVVNGFSALLAHYFSYSRWHRIDGMSMALTAWLACGFLLEEVSDNIFRTRKHGGWRTMLRLLVWVLICGIFFWFSEANGRVPVGSPRLELGDYAEKEVLIVLPLLTSVLLTILVIKRGWLDNAFVDAEVSRRGRRLFYSGLCIAAFGCACWIATEALCDTWVYIRYFPGHFLWHCTAAYGMTMMLMLGAILRADNFSKVAKIGRPRRKRDRRKNGLCSRLFSRAALVPGAYGHSLLNIYFAILPEFAHVYREHDAKEGVARVAGGALQAVRKVKRQSTRSIAKSLKGWRGRALTTNLQVNGDGEPTEGRGDGGGVGAFGDPLRGAAAACASAVGGFGRAAGNLFGLGGSARALGGSARVLPPAKGGEGGGLLAEGTADDAVEELAAPAQKQQPAVAGGRMPAPSRRTADEGGDGGGGPRGGAGGATSPDLLVDELSDDDLESGRAVNPITPRNVKVE